MFLCDNQWKFWTFLILQLWNKFSGKRKPFSENWSTIFKLKAIRLKTHHFHTKLSYLKPMLRQIVRWVQNGPITKKGVLPVTTLFFEKICFSLRISCKELIWCTDDPNARIRTFCKRCCFIWRCFFPVSILNAKYFNKWSVKY